MGDSCILKIHIVLVDHYRRHACQRINFCGTRKVKCCGTNEIKCCGTKKNKMCGTNKTVREDESANDDSAEDIYLTTSISATRVETSTLWE
jgi:hypothetical protein